MYQSLIAFSLLYRVPRSWRSENLSYAILLRRASLVVQRVEHLPAMQETWVPSLGQEDPLEEEMATHTDILAWKIPWTEKPGRVQSIGSQRIGNNWATSLSLSPVIDGIFSTFSSFQSLSCVGLFATPWIAAHQASLSITNSRSSHKLMSIEPVMPSSHLILSSPSPPACNPSQHQGLFQWVNSSHKVARVLEFQL